MEDKAVRGFSWTLFGIGLSKGLATVTTVVLAALVAPSDFGLVAIGLVVVNFVSWFGGSSFGATLIVHQDLDERGQGTVLSLSLLGAAASAVGILVLAPFMADALRQPRLTAVLAVLTISVQLSGLTAFYESLLQNELEFRRRFVALFTQTATFSVTAITLAALGAGVWSLVAGQVLSVALFAAMLVALAPRRVAPAWDRREVGQLFKTGRGFALQGITAFIRQNVDVMAVGRSFGASAVGFYAMAFRLGDLTYSALADPIARVTFPAFARSRARDEDIRPVFLAVLRVVALITVPCGVILSAAGEPFTRTFFGPEWAPMVSVLGVVGLWAAVRPVEATLGWLLNSLGHAGAVGRVAVFVIVPLVVGLVLVVGSGNLTLVALVPLADTLLYLAILTVLVGRHAGLPATALGRALAPVAFAGAVSWVVTRLYAEALVEVPAILALAGAAGAGGLVFGLTVLLVDRPLIRSTVAQGARLLGRGKDAARAS
jgi:O-antigen/teichoic acid export membrane protein